MHTYATSEWSNKLVMTPCLLWRHFSTSSSKLGLRAQWWTPLSNLLSLCTSYFNIQLVRLGFGGNKVQFPACQSFHLPAYSKLKKKLLGRNVKQPNLLQNMSRLIAGFTHELCRLFPKILILLDTMIHIPFLGKTSASLQIPPSIM